MAMKTTPFALAALLAAAGAQARGQEILEVEFRLIHGLGEGGTAAAGTGASLLVDAARTGGRWERVWAVSSESRKMHFLTGCVMKGDVSADRVAVEMALRLPGGAARVALDLKRGADGGLAGTYTITSGARKVTGAADGRIKPPRPPLPAGFVPLRPGQRPRILFRKADIPALKARLATPLGKVLFEKMGQPKTIDAVGAGIKYQLTGRAEFAEQAREFAAAHMAGKGPGYSQRTAWGRQPEQVALAYDLCFDAWPEDFRKQVVAYLLKTAEEYTRGRMSGGINWHVCSNWGAKIHAGSTFTVPRGNAVMRGTFIAPAGAKVEARLNEVMMKGYKASGLKKVPGILATGGDEFFLVATIGPASAAAPQVAVEGAGLSARVTVRPAGAAGGGRRVAFDGGRVTISDAK